jgi:hypothetical protein
MTEHNKIATPRLRWYVSLLLSRHSETRKFSDKMIDFRE